MVCQLILQLLLLLKVQDPKIMWFCKELNLQLFSEEFYAVLALQKKSLEMWILKVPEEKMPTDVYTTVCIAVL